METSKTSTGQQSSAPTSYVAATPANHSAPQESEVEQTTLDTFGRGSERPLATYDPNTRSWKMYGAISLWEDSPLLENLPPSGMTQNGELCLRPPWEDNTDASDCLLWPTPTTHGENIGTRIESQRRRLEKGLKYSSRLSQAIALREPDAIGYLSPMWTELLMGFPPGWTDLEG